MRDDVGERHCRAASFRDHRPLAESKGRVAALAAETLARMKSFPQMCDSLPGCELSADLDGSRAGSGRIALNDRISHYSHGEPR